MTRRKTPGHGFVPGDPPEYCARVGAGGLCGRPEPNAVHADPNRDPVPPMPERTDAEAVREARTRADAGMQQTYTANQPDRDAVRAAIVRAASGRDVLTANDVRPLLPPDVNTAVIGSVFNRMRREGLLTFEGYTASSDKGTHGKHINKWGVTPMLRALTGRQAA
ncbi:hypothetical protein [Cumulibacter soli]|uniref:hypothetical protein n=1 Tax=Cumulibacter soli TaxID=2546344 RepID=UPI00106837B3|nr:hypothetical protein [Cumulibacter soli]